VKTVLNVLIMIDDDHLNVYPHEQSAANYLFEDQSLTEKTIVEDLTVDEEELPVAIDAFGLVSNVSYGQNSKDDQATHMHSFFHYGREAKVCEFQISGNLSDQPTFDEYSDGEEQIPTSNFDDLSSIQPVYDSYESDFDEDIKEFQEHTINLFSSSIKEQHYVEINYPRSAEDIEHDGFNMVEDFRSSSPFAAPHEQKTGITYREEELKGSHEQPIQFKKQEEVTFYGHYSTSFVFCDPVAIYMEEFINSKCQSLFRYKSENQIYDQVLILVLVFILMKHIQRVWLVNQLLEFFFWKFVIT
jgi:hypothetical protein